VTAELKSRIEHALSGITNPRRGRDIVSAGMVRDIAVDDAGAVSFTFVLTREDPGSLARQARKAAESVAGVTAVKINVVDSADGGPGASARPAAPRQPAAPPAPPTPDEMPALGKVLAISSGKGGVGKSTVSANLAAALARDGHRVGLMDADIYGPNIPRMFGVFDKPVVIGGRIRPLAAHGIKLMSIGFLVDRDAPAIWRGPIIMKVIQQFLRDVDWGELDYFLVDMPPGTGDAQLSLVQSVAVSGAVIVTTPQEMAVGDALKGAKMFERVSVPVVGVVENMGPYTDPASGIRYAFFGEGGGQRLADEIGAPLLGSVPLQPGLAERADAGSPVIIAEPQSAAAQALRTIATSFHELAASRRMELPIISQ